MHEVVNKILNEILSGADAYKYVAVLVIAYPVMLAWLLFKASNRKPDSKTGVVSKFSWGYALSNNMPVVIYTSIFMNVFALWATSNFPAYKAIVLGIAIGLLSTSLGAISEWAHKALVKKVRGWISKMN